MTWLNSTLQIITDCWFWVPTFQNDCLHSSSTSLHTKWLCCFIYRSGVRVAPCLLSKQNPLPTLHKKTKQKNRKFRLTRKSLKKKYLFHKYQKCVDFHWRFYNSPYFLQAAIQRQSLGRVRLHLSIHFNPQFVSSWPDSRRNGGIFSPENSKILLWWKGKLEILILRCNPRVSSYIFPHIYIYTHVQWVLGLHHPWPMVDSCYIAFMFELKQIWHGNKLASGSEHCQASLHVEDGFVYIGWVCLLSLVCARTDVFVSYIMTCYRRWMTYTRYYLWTACEFWLTIKIELLCSVGTEFQPNSMTHCFGCNY